MARTRIFFATDIHGSNSCFMKFLNASPLYKADIMILGGDLSGKTLVPIVRRGEGYEATFLGVHQIIAEDGIIELENRIRSMGSYPYRVDAETYVQISEDPKKLDRLFERLIFERIDEWVALAENRLRGNTAEFYISGGNDDPPFVDEILRKSKVFMDPEEEVVKIHGGYEMITCGWSNPTPWNTVRETNEDRLKEILVTLASNVKSMSCCIFNVHVPPKDSGLDTAQKLDKDFRPIFSAGQPVLINAGSSAVREVIDFYQPMLGLHGHIHESRGTSKIGGTLCINPGSEYAETILRGVIMDIEGNKVKNYIFTSG